MAATNEVYNSSSNASRLANYPVVLTSPSNGQQLTFSNTNGGQWVNQSDTGTGVTNLNGLSGNLSCTTPNTTLTISTSGSNVTFDINLANNNTWTGVQTFASSALEVQNPAATQDYTIVGAAITASYNLTLPLITGNDTLAALNVAQTWTAAQTLENPLITDTSDNTKQIAFLLSGATTSTTLTISSSQTSSRTLTVPVLGGADTIVTLATTQTISAVKTFGNNISFGGATLNVSGLASGNLLQYNGTNWVNVTPTSVGASIATLGKITTYNSVSTAGFGIAAIVASGNLTAQTSAQTLCTFTPGSTGTFEIGGYINVTAISLDVLQLQATYTDENSTSQTQVFLLTAAGAGVTGVVATATATGNYSSGNLVIRASAAAITLKVVFTTGTGTVTYDGGGTIKQLA